jgi:hypothetical protein
MNVPLPINKTPKSSQSLGAQEVYYAKPKHPELKIVVCQD